MPYVHVPDGHGHGGFLESRIDVVDRNRVEWVRRVAAHVDDHPQPTTRTSSIYLLVGNEWRYLRVQVNGVDENVNVQYLLKRTTLGSFFQVPLENVLPRLFSGVRFQGPDRPPACLLF